jgi:hypothetical protein
MTKQQKSKFNPFAQMLRDDEEILWLYVTSSLSNQQYLKKLLRTYESSKYLLRLIIGCVLFILLGMGRLGVISVNTILQLTGIALVIAVVFTLLVITLMKRNSIHCSYALTTQRLISIESSTPEFLSVAAIKSVYIEGTTYKATITFTSADADAYIWQNAGEIETLLKLLRQTRKTLIKVMWL